MWHRRGICRPFILGFLILVAVSAWAVDEGQQAPRFTATTLRGEKFNNDSIKGKVVLLQFWATWCGYCRREQPIVDVIDREFAGKGLLVLAVDVGESKSTVTRYLRENPRSCRVVANDDTNLPAVFAARGFPFYVLIDREGNVAGNQRGAAGEAALRRLLRRAGLESD